VAHEITSSVEKHLLETSAFDSAQYAPTEKTRILVVNNFPELGKASAFRFLEWVQQNPEGLCSLPTGKTPEYFIKWVQRILKEWETPEIQKEVESYGLKPTKPDFSKLKFVQIDEFFPISPQQHNSFYFYVKKYYIEGFGFNPDNCLLIDCSRIGLEKQVVYGPTGEPEDYVQVETMDDVFPGGSVDLSLRVREATTRQERVQQRVLRQVDQWCADYEEKIRSMGGIGFFMGGIGPDGHIAFNCRGCPHHSTTRLDELNYESQAAAAGDLGGIEAVRKRKVITIGLGTITFNPNCVALTCAAGEAKAQVVRQAVEEDRHVQYPGTALHRLPNAVFFITTGAAKLMSQRRIAGMQSLETISDEVLMETLVNLSVKTRKKLVDLLPEDAAACPFTSSMLTKCSKPLNELAIQVRDSLIEKIEKGCRSINNTKFLHTEPHHDDIMLGYLPGVLRHTRGVTNDHYFTCGTSGFNSVSNKHMVIMLDRCLHFLESGTYKRLVTEGYFAVSDQAADTIDFRRRDVWKFLDGVAAADDELRDEGSARRFLANMCIIYGIQAIEDPAPLREKLVSLKQYFFGQYAGQPDDVPVQILKGSCREFEAECVWGHIGWQLPNISHLRLGFYTSEIWDPEPTHARDVAPVLKLLKDIQPDVVTVALDPEASGPDTHYKVLQAVTAAVEQHVVTDGCTPNMTIWGYRNVWFRFEPHEVSSIIPVSLQTIAVLNQMFLSSFESQRDAEFPAYEIQGPFCKMSQKVQVEQYGTIETCLGYEWFHKHPSPLIRATRGLIFLKEMSVQELLNASRALRRQAQNF
jgi:glucosamine-6-phosphate deaminase